MVKTLEPCKYETMENKFLLLYYSCFDSETICVTFSEAFGKVMFNKPKI